MEDRLWYAATASTTCCHRQGLPHQRPAIRRASLLFSQTMCWIELLVQGWRWVTNCAQTTVIEEVQTQTRSKSSYALLFIVFAPSQLKQMGITALAASYTGMQPRPSVRRPQDALLPHNTDSSRPTRNRSVPVLPPISDTQPINPDSRIRSHRSYLAAMSPTTSNWHRSSDNSRHAEAEAAKLHCIARICRHRPARNSCSCTPCLERSVDPGTRPRAPASGRAGS
ncbi:hypothetical protein C8R44DRAFT_788059 [Mycena epipterygia]|nr:hypothetical protein C8R44DRAFT_788059 [Mycena epipterygia]